MNGLEVVLYIFLVIGAWITGVIMGARWAANKAVEAYEEMELGKVKPKEKSTFQEKIQQRMREAEEKAQPKV